MDLILFQAGTTPNRKPERKARHSSSSISSRNPRAAWAPLADQFAGGVRSRIEQIEGNDVWRAS